MTASYVVTGGGRGVGRAIVERLLGERDTVVVIEFAAGALAWAAGHPAADRIVPVIGDAADESVADRAAERAEDAAPLTGWVNNAAIFRDAWLHETPAADAPSRSPPICAPRSPVAPRPSAAFSPPAAPARSSTCRPTRRSGRCGAP